MSRSHTAAARRSTAAPRAPRRVSGPVARPVPVPGRPRPSTPAAAVHAPGLGARVRALPDHRLLDTLLRSRAWIWLLGIALGGIVAMQVSLLGMNAGIGRAVAAQTTLEHSNAALEEQVAELSSGERIRTNAAKLGLLSPDAGSVAFLTARPGVDARRGAGRMSAPSDTARQAIASDGRSDAAPPPASTLTAVTPTITPVATVAAVATVAPVAPVAPAATAAPAVPAATAAPPGTTTTTTTGAVPAP